MALGAFFVLSMGIAACGSSIPGNSVAVMAGNPITTAAFNHWMFVAAKGNASQSTSAPVIVPNDPPDFSSCIAQVRAADPVACKTPDKAIKADCAELFSSLSSQVMNFLITAYWYQAQAHKDGITVTQAEVLKALATAKKQEFPTAAQFTAFLAATGQTLQDIYFRLRVSQIYTKLIAHYTKKVTPAAIQAYFLAHPTQFGTPETRNIRIVRANSEAGRAGGQVGAGLGRELGHASPRSIRSTPPPRTTAACWSASQTARRSTRSTKLPSRHR